MVEYMAVAMAVGSAAKKVEAKAVTMDVHLVVQMAANWAEL